MSPEDTPRKNPGGRPPKPLTKLRAEVRDQIDEMALEDAPRIYGLIKETAHGGSLEAQKFLADRAWPVRRGVIVRFYLPPIRTAADIGTAMDAVLEQTGSGDITIEECDKLVSMLANRLKVFEQADMAAEIAELRRYVQDKILAAQILPSTAKAWGDGRAAGSA